MGDAAADIAAVNFKLRFTRAAHTNTTCATTRAATHLARKMRPLAGEAGKTIFILGQFDLQRAFTGAGMTGKDIENEGGAIKQFDIFTQTLGQFALMARREFIVKDDRA